MDVLPDMVLLLITAARDLAAERMHYNRRISFGSRRRSFDRAPGTCSRQAGALKELLYVLEIRGLRQFTPTGTIKQERNMNGEYTYS